MGCESLPHPSALLISGQVASVEMPSRCDSHSMRSLPTTDFILIFTHIFLILLPSPLLGERGWG